MKVERDIEILIRGGKILRIPFSVTTTIPDIEILENDFNFGKITV